MVGESGMSGTDDSLIGTAYEQARDILEPEFPARWKHSKAVALKASKLASALAPRRVDEIVAASLMHDIGYATPLRGTGFHPIDGADFVARSVPQLASIAGSIAYHTGAVFEAAERGLTDELERFTYPDELDLAILTCADLCTGPDGAAVDPAARLTEVLGRYGSDHPVHRAIAKSRDWLIAQAKIVLAATKVACVDQVWAPDQADLGPNGWNATWCATDYQISANAESGRISVAVTEPDKLLDTTTGACLARDVHAATVAANGAGLGWNQYRATRVRGPEVWVQSFRLGDVLRLQREAMARGYEVIVAQRTFTTLGEVSQWVDLPGVLR